MASLIGPFSKRDYREEWICFCFASTVRVGAVGNTFESNRRLEEEGICRKVVLVRIEFMVADELTASQILEPDNNVIGNQALCRWW
jgi:hypothetical protein